MGLLTLLWTMGASVALTLAASCAWVWRVETRDPTKVMFCLVAVATAAGAFIEIGMMHAVTPAAYGEWQRWLHLPAFVAILGQTLLVYFYLRSGRLWLLATIIGARIFILVANFSVRPNFNFREIISLRQVYFLGEQISVVGDSVVRSWQWFATASLVLAMVFVIDAAIQAWRAGGTDARRKALAVGLAVTVPMVCNNVLGQLVVFGLLHIPLTLGLWSLGTVILMGYELNREFRQGKRAQLEVAKLQVELRQAERVGALGQLASALAHELVQPLTASLTNAEVALQHLQRQEPDLEEVRAIVADIGEDGARAIKIIDGMRDLIGRQSIKMHPLSLSDVVQGVCSLVRPEAESKGVALKVLMPSELPAISGDRVHLSQVLLNLLINGIDAVQLRPHEDRCVVVGAHAHEESGWIEITVEDSGPGISGSDLKSVFNPFFTTKPGGMGMGLTLASTIVTAHGGRLWAEDRPRGHGASFHFTLRRA